MLCGQLSQIFGTLEPTFIKFRLYQQIKESSTTELSKTVPFFFCVIETFER